MTDAASDSPSRRSVTALLTAWSGGDESALHELIPLVHAELRNLARRLIAASEAATRSRPPRSSTRPTFACRRHARALAGPRALLRDVSKADATHPGGSPRSRAYFKRGGGARRISLDEALVGADKGADLVALTTRWRHWRVSTNARARSSIAFLRRPDRGRDGGGAAHFAGDGGARLALCQDMVDARAQHQDVT